MSKFREHLVGENHFLLMSVGIVKAIVERTFYTKDIKNISIFIFFPEKFVCCVIEYFIHLDNELNLRHTESIRVRHLFLETKPNINISRHQTKYKWKRTTDSPNINISRNQTND